MKKYYVFWDYGYHKQWIETTKDNYYRVIKSMKSEFKVYYNEKEFLGLTKKNKKKKLKWNEHYIINYCGEKYSFASSEEIKRSIF